MGLERPGEFPAALNECAKDIGAISAVAWCLVAAISFQCVILQCSLRQAWHLGLLFRHGRFTLAVSM